MNNFRLQNEAGRCSRRGVLTNFFVVTVICLISSQQSVLGSESGSSCASGYAGKDLYQVWEHLKSYVWADQFC